MPDLEFDLAPEWDELLADEAQQIDGVCDRFEHALTVDSKTRIEAFVTDFFGSRQKLILLELVPIEVEL